MAFHYLFIYFIDDSMEQQNDGKNVKKSADESEKTYYSFLLKIG